MIDKPVEIIVSENSQLIYSIDFLSDRIHIIFYLHKNASLTCHFLFAQCSAHVTIEMVLLGAGAHAYISGLYLLSGDNMLRVETRQHHKAEYTTSKVVVKGLVNGASHAQYQGTIKVEQFAHGSTSSQENKNILLAHGARALSVPNLEILNNDVRCFHGSAVARCDEEQLMYAMSRGISENQAKRLMVRAFIADMVSNEIMQKRIEEYIACI